MTDYRDCPFCAEKILIKAKKCKHCQSMINDAADNRQQQEFEGKKEALLSKDDGPPPASSAFSPPPPPVTAGKKQGGPLKTILIVVGSIVGFVALVFIAMFIYFMVNPADLEVESVATALSVDEDGRAVDPTDTFYPDSGEIYVALEINNIPANTILESSWYFEDDDYFIDSASIELPRGQAYAYFHLFIEDWPVGSYRVDLSVDDEIIATARFGVVIETGTISYEYEGDQGEYSGQLRTGLRHGQGYWENEAGDLYDGEWAFGLPHGFGFFDSSTAAYEGYWFEGNLHGEGILVMYDEFIFTGSFKEGDLHGQGRLEFEDGTVIEGEWYEGELLD